MRVPATVLSLCLLVLAPSAALALERALVRDAEDADPWIQAGYCPPGTQYFNNCTAWSWLWSGWQPGDEASVSYTLGLCTDFGPYIGQVQMRFRDDSPPGYGYTGTLSVRAADANGCPIGPILDQSPVLPHHGWNFVDLSAQGLDRAVVTFTTGPGGLASRLYSDFTSAPGYPEPCGTCYSPYREPHSYRRDSWDVETCLGEPIEASGCYSEWQWSLHGAVVVTGGEGHVPVTMPEIDGTVSPGTGFYPWNAPLTIAALPDSGFQFWRWAGSGEGSYNGHQNPATIVPRDSVHQFAEFVPLREVTIDLEPAGHSLIANDVYYDAPETFIWGLHTSYTIGAEELPPQTGPTRKRFHRWSDGITERIRDYTVADELLELIGYYRWEHLFTGLPDTQGTVLPADEWFGHGEVLEIQAIPEYGFAFDRWEGEGDGSYSGTDNPGTVIMNGPIVETAVFVDAPAGVTLSLSASAADPFVNADAPAQFTRDVYLWVACVDLGVSALEAHIDGSMQVLGFTPEPGVQNHGSATELLLDFEDCVVPDTTPQRAGRFTVLDLGGSLCLGASSNVDLATADCDPDGVRTHPNPQVIGFATDGSAPCVAGGEGCGAANPVGVNPAASVEGIAFAPVSPNPVSANAEFVFQVDRDLDVALEIFDVRGRRVVRLGEESYPIGSHSLRWNLTGTGGAPMPAGVYFARFTAGETTTVRKFTVVRR